MKNYTKQMEMLFKTNKKLRGKVQSLENLLYGRKIEGKKFK